MKLRVALVVPDLRVKDWYSPKHCQYPLLAKACANGEVDLVVLPEAYYGLYCDTAKIKKMSDVAVKDWYEYVKVPVLVGMQSTDGYQVAVYVNPDAKRTETKSHLYFKHSSATKLAFDQEGYESADDTMFDPVQLRRARIGVQICHDMFFGLVGHQLREHGANVYLNITGGNVRKKKWRDVIAGRSLELDAPFLCTMSRRCDGNDGDAFATAFDRGRELQPTISHVNDWGYGGFKVFDIDSDHVPSRTDDVDQGFTGEQYKDILISVGRKKPRSRHHIHIVPGRDGMAPMGRAGDAEGKWRGFDTPSGRVGVLPLSIAKLADGLAIHRHEADLQSDSFDHHVVVYFGEPKDWNAAMALMKLRAIEHRIAVVVADRSRSECLKTTRRRTIQRFRQRRGVFALNGDCLGGTIRALNGKPGIPGKHHPAYLDLLT